MSAGEIAGLIAAGAFALLVLLLAIPLLKLGRTLDEATLTIRQTREGTAPLLAQAQGTVTAVNAQLEQVESITKDVNSMTSNAAALTSVVSSTLGGPLIKLAAFSYGVAPHPEPAAATPRRSRPRAPSGAQEAGRK